MTTRNPKQDKSILFDCIPQIGPCPMNCNQCFYNRPNAFYVPIDKPSIPTPEEVGDGIVRMNCGNDSNNEKELVIQIAKSYKYYFFNTSIPKFDFPGPVVWTANPKEEESIPLIHLPLDIMFVRLRVSSTNLEYITKAINFYTHIENVPIVLTFMAYYDYRPDIYLEVFRNVGQECYEWKVRHINSYWCPTKAFIKYVRNKYKDNRLVSICGSIDNPYCKDCRNCETYYIQTIKRLKGE